MNRSVAPTLALALLLAAPAVGQDLPLASPPAVSASPTHTALAPSLVSGGVDAASASLRAEAALGGPVGAGYRAASAQFELRGGGASFAAPTLASSGPLLAGVEPRIVRASGDTIALYGAGFASGGAPSVTVGDLPAASVSVVSDTELSVVTPVLTNLFGNPLGAVDVRVTNANGTAEVDGLAIASPAYLQTSPARLDSTFDVTHFGQPGGTAIPSWGAPLPGVVIPIAGIGGAIELPLIFLTSAAETLDATGVSSSTYPIPDDPVLIGRLLQFQSVVFESFSPFVASFTNTVDVQILP